MMKKNRKHVLTVTLGIAVVLFGLGIRSQNVLWSSSAAESRVVISYSDQAPRIGNNVYGYMDVPDTFSEMKGSFDPDSELYGGMKDGRNEGVSIYRDEAAYISISLIDAESGLEDYIGIGLDEYVPYGEKDCNLNAENAAEQFIEALFESGSRVNCAEGGPIEVGGLSGMEMMWDYEEGGSDIQNVVYFLDNPKQTNTVHCIVLKCKKGQEEYIDYLRTFSLYENPEEQNQTDNVSTDKTLKVGSELSGYMNIPAEYFNYWGDFNQKQNEDVNLVYFADKEKVEKGIALNESMVMATFRKNKVFEKDILSDVEPSLVDLFGHFNIYSWNEDTSESQLMSSVELKQGDFTAGTFASIFNQVLSLYGTVECRPIEVDGANGYEISWEGRYNNYGKGYASFYILDSTKDADIVQIIGARTNKENGELLQFLSSFSFEE